MKGYKKVEVTKQQRAHRMVATISHNIIVVGRAVSNRLQRMGFKHFSLYYNDCSVAICGEKDNGREIKGQIVIKYKEIEELLEKNGITYDDKLKINGEWVNENTIVFKLKEG